MPEELEELQDLLEPKEAKRKFKEHLFNQWHGKCAYCDRRAEDKDHIKPKFKGGDDRLTNLVPSCLRCNQDKGSKDMETWWRSRYWWDEDRFNAVQFWQENGYLPIDQSGT